MAEVTAEPCCTPTQQAVCCEPRVKADCCGPEGGCNCDVTPGAPGEAPGPAWRELDVRATPTHQAIGGSP
jgi:hypothetical protein